MIKLKSSAATHVGLRRTANEDRYLADDDRGLYVVCDGMGGHRSGELAAQTALDTFVAILDDKTGDMSSAIDSANNAVVRIEGMAGYRSPGSTLTALRILEDGTAEWAQAGDSDLLRFRDGKIDFGAPHHNSWEGGLSNFCGIGDEFQVCTGKTSALVGDRFIVASDGLARHFNLKMSKTFADFMQKLYGHDLAELLTLECVGRGGKDNITVIIVDVLEG
jgi:serine/threonine protein phosphatase PrpC